MTGREILGFAKVNPVEKEKVLDIFKSIKNNGWNGAPILCWGNQLITGSHRLAALEMMEEEGENIDFECAIDVSDIIDEKIESGMTQQDIFENLDYLRFFFAGTYIEKYKDEIEEW